MQVSGFPLEEGQRGQGWLQRNTLSIGQDPFCAISAVMGLVLWMHAYYKYVAEYPMQSHILHSIDSGLRFQPHPNQTLTNSRP